ncbi:MAG: histidinol-phosphate aminotransferase family protein [Planctomycetota bacterium]|nr:MAG: histidinol-phosphate aminotransferase family protein [Planctomycetota bacterium]
MLSSPARRIVPRARRIRGLGCYRTERPVGPIELDLARNEGPAPDAALARAVAERSRELMRRYPDTDELRGLLAKRHGVDPAWVLITAGADDALMRAALAVLDPGCEALLTTPAFEMLRRYVRLAGAAPVEVPWLEGAYPLPDVSGLIGPRTRMIVVVSPNNPTGGVAEARHLRALSRAAPAALLLVDLAYVEFADQDLTPCVLGLPNALAVRTFSKAWGLAGLRVGYVLGRPEVVEALRAAGSPYAVSSISAAIAAERLRRDEDAVMAFVERVRSERDALTGLLTELGAAPLPSQANFVLVRVRNARGLWASLGRCGIAVRIFPGDPLLRDWVRISCPGEPHAFDRLVRALRRTLGCRKGYAGHDRRAT